MPRRAVLALVGAAAGVVLLVLTWFLAFHVGIVEHADQSIYNGFGNLGHHPRVSSLATLHRAAVQPVAVRVSSRRSGRHGAWRGGGSGSAVAIGAILLGANVTTQLLKPLLAHAASR